MTSTTPRYTPETQLSRTTPENQANRSWIRVDASGKSETIQVDKLTMMRRCELPGRDLRLLDPKFDYPSTILGREKAIVVKLEHIRCVITAEEVLLISLDPYDSLVELYVTELQRRLTIEGTADTNQTYLPFEFRALEVALDTASTFLDSEAAKMIIQGESLINELTSKISTPALERERKLKSALVPLTGRVQKVRDELEQLLDDDGDMAEMYLTEKKQRIGEADSGPVSSPPDSGKRQELEMLLEAYFVVIDSTLNKLKSLNESIEDTEDFINIELDNVRNRLMIFGLMLTSATFVFDIFALVAGVFGMNFKLPLYEDAAAFKWIIIITGIFGIILFCAFVLLFKCRRLLYAEEIRKSGQKTHEASRD